MHSNEKISEVFRRTIFASLEKVDVSQSGQRKAVYEAALKSLKNVHFKNHNLTENIKREQCSILSALIIEIETKITNINDEENPVVSDVEPVSHINENEFLLDDDITAKSSIGSFFNKIRTSLFYSKIFGKRIIATVFFALLALVGISAYYGSLKETENSAEKLLLPYVLNADQTLFDFGKSRDKGSIKLAQNVGEGIIYEVDINSEDTKNRVDFILKGDLSKKIIAHDEPILLTLHIEKISKEDVELNLLYRGSGKSVRKSVKIVDESTNEFFLITNAKRDNKERSATLIRLDIAPTSEKFEEKPVLLLKKITFSKI